MVIWCAMYLCVYSSRQHLHCSSFTHYSSVCLSVCLSVSLSLLSPFPSLSLSLSISFISLSLSLLASSRIFHLFLFLFSQLSNQPCDLQLKIRSGISDSPASPSSFQPLSIEEPPVGPIKCSVVSCRVEYLMTSFNEIFFLWCVV